MRFSGLQLEVLQLYRAFLRAAQTKPLESRASITATIRAEFEKGKTQLGRMDIDAIQARLRAGKKKLRLLQSPRVKSVSTSSFPTPQSPNP